MLEGKVIIAVDFDGTITNERDIQEKMTLKVGAKEVLNRWYDKGHKLILWTCRTGESFENALNFLEENYMLHLFSAFNDQLPEINEKFYPDVARKVGADYYVDDRQIGVTINWYELDTQLKEDLTERGIM